MAIDRPLRCSSTTSPRLLRPDEADCPRPQAQIARFGTLSRASG